jgi:hypothetical protein
MFTLRPILNRCVKWLIKLKDVHPTHRPLKAQGDAGY